MDPQILSMASAVLNHVLSSFHELFIIIAPFVIFPVIGLGTFYFILTFPKKSDFK